MSTLHSWQSEYDMKRADMPGHLSFGVSLYLLPVTATLFSSLGLGA
jgi:hypothetical protein